MSLIIDTCAFAKVFDCSCLGHGEYIPVLNWIKEGPGIIIYGGTKFQKELGEGKYRRLFLEYKKARKAVEIKKELVDSAQAFVTSLESSKDFDDQHIVALLRVSKCGLFVTCDDRSHKYVKSRKFYPKGQKIPKIYKSSKNKYLLIRKNIVKIEGSLLA